MTHIFLMMRYDDPRIAKAQDIFEHTLPQSIRPDISFWKWYAFFRSDMSFGKIAKEVLLTREAVSKKYARIFREFLPEKYSGIERLRAIRIYKAAQSRIRLPLGEPMRSIAMTAKNAGCTIAQDNHPSGIGDGIWRRGSMMINGVLCCVAELKNTHPYGSRRLYFRSRIPYDIFAVCHSVIFFLRARDNDIHILVVPSKALAERYGKTRKCNGIVSIYIATKESYQRARKNRFDFWRYENAWPAKKTVS